jgi:SAM-dependent methyltransferase
LDPTSSGTKAVRGLGGQGVRGVLQASPFRDGSFDIVIASEVLEHIPQASRCKAVSEIARVLKTGGWLIGTVPYRENLDENQVVCPGCGLVFHRWGHADWFDRDKLMRELGPWFRVRRCRPVAFVDWRSVRTPLSAVKAVAKAVLGRMGEGVVYPSLFFEAERV